MTCRMRIMNPAKGDATVTWDPEVSEDTSKAKEVWDRAVFEERFVPYRVETKGGRKTGVEMPKDFPNPSEEEEFLLVPPMAGGC